MGNYHTAENAFGDQKEREEEREKRKRESERMRIRMCYFAGLLLNWIFFKCI